MGDTLDFMRTLWALAHALEKRSRLMKRTLGVTGPQRLTLRIIGRFPMISAGHLADILHVHASTLTGILQRLERRGLIARRSDPVDRRRVLFTLTAKGRELDEVHEGTAEGLVRLALARVPAEARETAAEVLQYVTLRLDGYSAFVNGQRPTRARR